MRYKKKVFLDVFHVRLAPDSNKAVIWSDTKLLQHQNMFCVWKQLEKTDQTKQNRQTLWQFQEASPLSIIGNNWQSGMMINAERCDGARSVTLELFPFMCLMCLLEDGRAPQGSRSGQKAFDEAPLPAVIAENCSPLIHLPLEMMLELWWWNKSVE